MKGLTWYWNIVYYFLFVWLKATRARLFSLGQSLAPLLQRELANRNEPKSIIKQTYDNPRSGLVIHWANVSLYFLLVVLMMGILNFSDKIIGPFDTETGTRSIFIKLYFIIPPLLLNYYFLEKDKKYLNHFNLFDKMGQRERIKYSLVTILIIGFILMFGFLSFLS